MTSDFVSKDGSPLAMYLALPAGDAPMIVHDAVPFGSTILELGSGPGRLTRVLVALGHEVTAVDDSAEMLEHITGAEAVRGDLLTLDLGRRFDVVMAASHLVNVPGIEDRRRLLRTCRRHLADDGLVVVERHAPGWLLSCNEHTDAVGPVEMSFVPGDLDGDVRAASVTYSLGGRSWCQRFRSEDVDDTKLSELAAEVGLVIDQVLTDDERWLTLTTADVRTR